MNFVIMVDIPDPNTDSKKIMTSIFVKWIKGAEKEKYLQVKVSSRNRHGSSQPSATITITTQRSGCMLYFYDYHDDYHHIVINWVLDSDRSRHTADGENNRGLCLCWICWYWWYCRCRCSLFILRKQHAWRKPPFRQNLGSFLFLLLSSFSQANLGSPDPPPLKGDQHVEGDVDGDLHARLDKNVKYFFQDVHVYPSTRLLCWSCEILGCFFSGVPAILTVGVRW